MSRVNPIVVLMRRRRKAGAPPRLWDMDSRAFSLIEVVLALGIISFCFIGLLGLMSAGLKSFEAAIDNTVATQIAQNVIGKARQAGFSRLAAAGPGSTLYFDEEGNAKSGPVDAIYAAAFAVDYGNGSERLASSASLARVRVNVTKVSSPRQGKVYTAFIADNGS